MTDWQDNLKARHDAAFFSADRGFSKACTVTSGGTAYSTRVVWTPRQETVIRDSGEISESHGVAMLPKSGCTLTQSRAGDWGMLTVTLDGTSNTFRITEKRKESDSVYHVACSIATTTQLGRTT